MFHKGNIDDDGSTNSPRLCTVGLVPPSSLVVLFWISAFEKTLGKRRVGYVTEIGAMAIPNGTINYDESQDGLVILNG